MKTCANCGTSNEDASLFCQSCGTALESAPQPESAQSTPYAAPAYTSPQQPAQSTAVSVLKGTGASPLFLVAIILFSAMILFQLINAFAVQTSVSFADNFLDDFIYSEYGSDFYTYESDLEDLEGALNAFGGFSVAGTIIGLIPNILIAIGMWMFYGASRSSLGDRIATGGLTMVKVISIIQLVLACIGFALAEIMLVLVITASNLIPWDEIMSEFTYDYNLNIAGILTPIIIAGIVVVAIVAVLYILYMVKIIKTIGVVSYTASAGQASAKISMYLIVMNFIGAGCAFLSGISINPLTFLTNGCLAGFLVIISIGLLQYRTKMQALVSPSPYAYGQPYPYQQP